MRLDKFLEAASATVISRRGYEKAAFDKKQGQTFESILLGGKSPSPEELAEFVLRTEQPLPVNVRKKVVRLIKGVRGAGGATVKLADVLKRKRMAFELWYRMQHGGGAEAENIRIMAECYKANQRVMKEWTRGWRAL